MKKSVVIVLAAGLVAAGAAFAGEKGDWEAKVEAPFKEVDANADGSVTEDELVAFMTAKAKKEFASMAGDDGMVSLDKAKAHHKAKHEEMMKEHKNMDHGDKGHEGKH